MDRWKNKIAVITGAGSGIGAACAVDFIKSGMIVVGIGRRIGRMEAVKALMPEGLLYNFYPIKCDVTVEKEVVNAFKWIVKKFKGIDVLVNCAGIYREGTLTDKINSYKDILYTTLMGTMFCTRESVASMKEIKAPGHIFFITTALIRETGYVHYWEDADVNVFGGGSHGVRAMAETYRQEFCRLDVPIKTTNISIGITATDLWSEDIRTFVAEFPFLEPSRVSDAIMFTLSTPPNVEVTNLTIKPLGEKF